MKHLNTLPIAYLLLDAGHGVCDIVVIDGYGIANAAFHFPKPFDRHRCRLSDMLFTGGIGVLGVVAPLGLFGAVRRLEDLYGQTHTIALFRSGTMNTTTYPESGVGGESDAFSDLEPVGGLHESEIAFLNSV